MKLTESVLQELQQMAADMIPCNTTDDLTWSVVFYEVPFRSDRLGVPHRFREIRRWPV